MSANGSVSDQLDSSFVSVQA